MGRRADLEGAFAPIAPYLAALAAAYSALSGLLWLAGELAGWLWTRRWPPSAAGPVFSVLGRAGYAGHDDVDSAIPEGMRCG